MMMIDSAAVQAAMLRLGVGVMELAKIAEIPPKTISALHRRDKPVYLPTLARLAKDDTCKGGSVMNLRELLIRALVRYAMTHKLTPTELAAIHRTIHKLEMKNSKECYS